MPTNPEHAVVARLQRRRQEAEIELHRLLDQAEPHGADPPLALSIMEASIRLAAVATALKKYQNPGQETGPPRRLIPIPQN